MDILLGPRSRRFGSRLVKGARMFKHKRNIIRHKQAPKKDASYDEHRSPAQKLQSGIITRQKYARFQPFKQARQAKGGQRNKRRNKFRNIIGVEFNPIIVKK